jgi:hypothetical protein
VDYHRPDAVRILDFPHAGEHLNTAGGIVFGEGTSEAQGWLADQLHRLKHDGPDSVLTEVRRLVATRPEQPDLGKELAYLEKRAAHMAYPAFRAAGWPIGDGAVESANKLVVEARLKGSGMHWARSHVDPMLALRNIVCNDRWEEAWPQIVSTLRQQERQRRTERRHKRQASITQPVAAPVLSADSDSASAAARGGVEMKRPASKPPRQSVPGERRRRAANHPWRRMPIGRERFMPATKDPDAKL